MIYRNCPICKISLTYSSNESDNFRKNTYHYYSCGTQSKYKRHYWLQTNRKKKLVLIKFSYSYKYDIEIYLDNDFGDRTRIKFCEKFPLYCDDSEIFQFYQVFNKIIIPDNFSLESIKEKYDPIINSFIFE